jgi:nicotinamidase/pyrazinamidase
MDFAETASVEVDPQCGFSGLCPEELPVPGALEIVDPLNRQANCTVLRVASRDAHSASAHWIASKDKPQLSVIEGQKDLDVRWNAHCIVGTPGFHFLPGLNAENYDFIAYKGIEPSMHPYGACYRDLAKTKSTGLMEFLRYNGIENVIVGGLATSFCLKETVLELCAYGEFTVFVNLDACRDLDGMDTDAVIAEMEQAGAIMVTTEEIETAFNS